jgi:hypothetical protein
MLCPRWDSKSIPALVITGNLRKHAEPDPIRPMYDPARRPKCAHCAHPKFALSRTPNENRAPTQGTRFVFAPALPAGTHRQPDPVLKTTTTHGAVLPACNPLTSRGSLNGLGWRDTGAAKIDRTSVIG